MQLGKEQQRREDSSRETVAAWIEKSMSAKCQDKKYLVKIQHETVCDVIKKKLVRVHNPHPTN